MRYGPEHKAKTHQKIVKDASRRFRAEGLNGASVAEVMRDTGLTHGGFYKHFRSKDDLLVESLGEAFREIGAKLTQIAEQSPSAEAWKAIVTAYLSPQHCNHAEKGCPLAAIGPELARTTDAAKKRIVPEMLDYKDQLVRFMPGKRLIDRERAFYVIYSTMLGAVQIARMTPGRAARKRILDTARDFLLDTIPALPIRSDLQSHRR